MRHLKAHRKLGRTTEHRISMLRNLATSLINSRDDRIVTTVPKATEPSWRLSSWSTTRVRRKRWPVRANAPKDRRRRKRSKRKRLRPPRTRRKKPEARNKKTL